MGGRKAQPAALIDNKKTRKTKNELEARAAAEVTGCSAELKPPVELSERARVEWRRLIRLYRQLDAEILNDLDVGVLAAYCESRAIYQTAEEEYQKGKLVLRNPDGRIIENPYLKIMRLEGANLAKYSEQLCLSPVGRARMGVAAAKKEIKSDPLADLLLRGRDG